MCYLGMDPNIQCVTLWRDPVYCEKFPGRQELLEYATSKGIQVTVSVDGMQSLARLTVPSVPQATKKHSYSEDENMMHISYESGGRASVSMRRSLRCQGSSRIQLSQDTLTNTQDLC